MVEQQRKTEETDMQRVFVVRAIWDKEAQVWFAQSEDVPGLATESGTLDGLMSKLESIVPDLLRMNGILPNHDDDGLAPFELIAHSNRIGAGKAAA